MVVEQRDDHTVIEAIHGELSNSVNEQVVYKVEVETSRIIKKITQRNGTNHSGEDQPGDRVHQDSPESVHRQSC